MAIRKLLSFVEFIPVSQLTLRLGTEAFIFNLSPVRFFKCSAIMNTDISPNTYIEALREVYTIGTTYVLLSKDSEQNSGLNKR